MNIKEIKKIYYDCSVLVRRDANGVPYFVEVLYCGQPNQMSLPHTVATYIQTPRGWEKEE